MQLVTLSIARNILKSESRDRERMRQYAEHLDGLHIVVLTRKKHDFSDEVHEGKLHIYPTHSRSRFLMLIDGFRIAYRILCSKHESRFTITAQDPLELGLVSYILSRITNTPFTVQMHGDYYSPYWTEGKMTRYLRRMLIPRILARATKVRIVSSRQKTSLDTFGIPEEKITTLPIRPELETFLQAYVGRAENSRFTILTASRLAPEKNIPLLIEAFALFHTSHPDSVLRIVGEGEEYAHILHAVKKYALLSVVHIVPWTEHIETEMAAADVFVLTSLHESYGLVLLESLATGTPVITTDVGMAREHVLDGIHGSIVPVNDVNAVVTSLCCIYEDRELRKEMGRHGHELAKKLSLQSREQYAKEWVAAHTV